MCSSVNIYAPPGMDTPQMLKYHKLGNFRKFIVPLVMSTRESVKLKPIESEPDKYNAKALANVRQMFT